MIRIDPINKKIFRNTVITTIFSELTLLVATLVDTFVAGRFSVGHEALSALAVASPIISLLAAFSGVLATGAQTIAAKKLATADTEGAKKVFNLSVFLGLLISLLLGVLTFIFTEQIVSLFGAGKALGSTHDIACSYMLGLVPEFPAFILINIMTPFLFLDGARKKITFSFILFITTDVVLDFIVAFLFNGSVFGLAMATTLAQWICFLTLLTHQFKKNIIFKINFHKLDYTYLKEILLIGEPVATRRVANILRKICMNVILASVASGYGLAALSVQNQVKDVGDALGVGIAAATLLMVGISIGDCNIKDTKNNFLIGVRHLTYTLFLGILIALASPIIARLFNTDSNALSHITFALFCYGISLPITAFNLMYINYLQGSKNIRFSSILNFLKQFAYIVPCSFLLSKLWGMKGVFLAFPVSELLIVFTIVIFLQVKYKKYFYEQKTS